MGKKHIGQHGTKFAWIWIVPHTHQTTQGVHCNKVYDWLSLPNVTQSNVGETKCHVQCHQKGGNDTL